MVHENKDPIHFLPLKASCDTEFIAYMGGNGKVRPISMNPTKELVRYMVTFQIDLLPPVARPLVVQTQAVP